MPRGRELALILLVGVLAVPQYASALAQRTFVASYGSDASACSVTAPCRSFTSAVSKTTAGGEVIVLDSAGYGPVVITKSVSIIAPPGVYAGISVSGSANPGVHLNAPGIIVRLSGLTITGLADNNYGILYQSAAKLVVDRVTVTGFTGASGFGIVTSTFG